MPHRGGPQGEGDDEVQIDGYNMHTVLKNNLLSIGGQKKGCGARAEEGRGEKTPGGGWQEGQEEEGFLDARTQKEAPKAVDDEGRRKPEESAEAYGIGAPEHAFEAIGALPQR